MMTPAQLKAYEFKSAGRNAYKSDDVDVFFGEVLVNYEKMFRENSELIKRVSLLAEKLEQYKNDEVDIKQAVMSAQKAANLIVREAEESVADSKVEAEAILAAAKGEAEIIKSDAEKQAIADAELALSLAKDKAEEIIAKAKEKAHGILIAANESASNTMGAANRTITSESLHYDMLKKEVSEFRASILAQYKAHIELISKLPELAVEEASKIENVELPEKTVDELEEFVDNGFQPVEKADVEDSVLEFVEQTDDEELSENEIEAGETVVKTELPYDFFGDNTNLQFVEDDFEEEKIPSIDEFEASCENEAEESVDFESSSEEATNEAVEDTEVDIDEVDEEASKSENEPQPQGIPISRFFDNDEQDLIASSAEAATPVVEHADTEPANYDIERFENNLNLLFDNIEKIDESGAEDEAPAKRRGLFRKKK